MKSAFSVFVVCLAVVISGACGGGSASGSESTPSGAGGPVGSGEPAEGGSGAASGSEGGSSSGAGAAGEAEQAKPKSPAQEEAEERAAYERKRYGPASRLSAGFRHSARQGVLKHLPEYGREANSGQHSDAQALLESYLGATGEKDWKKACEYLLPAYVTQLVSSISTQSVSHDCPGALQLVYENEAEEPGPRFPDTAQPVVTSLRVVAYPPGQAARQNVEQAGFALMHGSDGEDYFASMTREEGRWLLTLPMPHPLR